MKNDKKAPDTTGVNIFNKDIITQNSLKRDSIIFYRSFFESLAGLDNNIKLELLEAIMEYALNGKEKILAGITKNLFSLIKPQLEANNKKFIDGQKGGRPRKTSGYENYKTSGYEKQKPNVNENKNINENRNNNVNKKENTNKIKYLTFPGFKYINLTKGEYDTLVDKNGEEKTMKVISLFDSWLEKGSKKSKEYIGKPHYAHFKSDSWVWDRANEIIKQEQLNNNNSISAEYGRY